MGMYKYCVPYIRRSNFPAMLQALPTLPPILPSPLFTSLVPRPSCSVEGGSGDETTLFTSSLTQVLFENPCEHRVTIRHILLFIDLLFGPSLLLYFGCTG